MAKDDILASVILITYNQEQYIRQSLDSILAQKTDFAFEIVVGDDHSIDATYDIIKSYQKAHPDIIRIRRAETNRGVLDNFKQTALLCRGEYIAVCAGDDYWTDQNKIKKQVDYLENHPETGLCYTDFYYLDSATHKQFKQSDMSFIKKVRKSDPFTELLFHNYIGTLTACLRSSYLKEYFTFIGDDYYNFLMEDKPLWLYISYHTKIHYLNEVTAVHRILRGSLSNPVDKEKKLSFYKSNLEISLYFIKKFGINSSLKEKLLIEYHRKIFVCAIFYRMKEKATEAFLFLKDKKLLTLKYRILYHSIDNPLLFLGVDFLRKHFYYYDC